MCGIAGIRTFDGAPVDEATVRAMTGALAHRGPDEEGYLLGAGFGLGHRRLSIIDLGGSHQPMSSADGKLHLVYNGEIFNYRALRREVADGGYAFRTEGDTEVLLALFLAHGAAGIERVQGQFAFALLDERDGSLWLFRDRLGILPLFWWSDGRRLAFASEVKALLPLLGDAAQVDDASLADYLAHRSVPAPHTLFQGVFKLEPGHVLQVTAAGERRDRAFWRLPNREPERGVRPEDAVERVAEALRKAVEDRLVADVPVGAYLSGGVDSSLITALVTAARDGAPVETYSAGFADPRFDELPWAEEVSRALGTNHHPVVVGPRDFEELWSELTWHRDAPLSEPGDVAVHKLAKLARQRVKVLLSGEGSDELFGGYPKYRFAKAAATAALAPSGARSWLLTRAERALPFGSGRPRTMLRAMAARDEADRFQAWFAPFTRAERERLFPVSGRDGHRALAQRARGDLLQRMLYVDCHTWLADNLLERGDRMSMSASVEVRPPFMDHELVELAFSLPSDVKVRGQTTKWVVKEIARRHLPARVVDRKKVGFRVPLDEWFRGHLRELAGDLLLSPRSFVADRFDQRHVAALVSDHDRGRRNEELRIWTLLCLEIWHRRFFPWRHGG